MALPSHPWSIKTFQEVGLLFCSRLYHSFFSLNSAAAKTAVWSLSSGFCHQPSVMLGELESLKDSFSLLVPE